MCEVLQIPRSTYYYEAKERDAKEEEELTKLIKEIFKENRRVYGQRKIKIELQRLAGLSSPHWQNYERPRTCL